MRETDMNISPRSLPASFARPRRRTLSSLLILGLAALLLTLLQSCSSNSKQSGADDNEAQAFESPDQAVDALTTALRAGDTPRLMAIMGPEGEDIVSSGDDVADRVRGQKFLKLYDEK